MKPRVAVDVNLGRKRIEKLKEHFEIVCIANAGEADKSWIERAFMESAEFIISNDRDVPFILENEGYPMAWVNFPLNMEEWRGKEIEFVHKSIDRKKQRDTTLINLSIDKVKQNGKMFKIVY